MPSLKFRPAPLLKLRWVLTGFVLGVAMLATAAVIEPGYSATPRTIPYDGFLTIDGAAAEGNVSLTFRLHTGETCTNCQVWSETQTVTARHGRFSATLGKTAPIDQVIFDADQVYLNLEVGGQPVGGRHLIGGVPWAQRAARTFRLIASRLVSNPAANLTVEGNLRVTGNSIYLYNAPDPFLQYNATNDSLVLEAPLFVGTLDIDGKLKTNDLNFTTVNNVGQLSGVTDLSVWAPATNVVAPRTGTATTFSTNEEWADCGTKPVTSVKITHVGGGPNIMALEVECGQ